MKTKEKLIYEYDPQVRKVNIIRDGVHIGGFDGASAEKHLHENFDNDHVEIKITDMSKSIKSARIKRLRAMWVKQGVDQYRESILEPYGVTSTADLSLDQLDELIDRFNTKTEVTDRTRSLRSNVLVMLDKLGIYADNGDWKQVNAFLMQSKIAGKMLYQLNDDELLALGRKLRSILEKNEKAKAEVERQKLLN